MTRLHEQLAHSVLDALEADGLTEAELAERAGISQKDLSLILRGSATGSIEMWDRLASLSADSGTAPLHPLLGAANRLP